MTSDKQYVGITEETVEYGDVIPRYTLDKHTATAEQAEIIRFALERPENILINALAGAAKTSTLRFLAKYMSMEPTLSLAFNKRIADEMTKVLPGHVKAATMNSVGHRVWAAAVGKRLVLETKKNFNIVKAEIEKLPRRERLESYEIFSEITKAIASAKTNGYIPAGTTAGRSLTTKDTFYASLEEEPDGWFIDLVDRSLVEGIRQAYGGLIDFDDQIYMSTLFGGAFPQFKRLMLDEVQDFSPLFHAMVARLMGPQTRLIAVGDPNQSIYAFRGADTSSMALIKHRFDMHEMTLSVSFRCCKSVVRNVWDRVPHMKWPEWAIEGTVAEMEEWGPRDIPDDSAIICRNNAPLLKCALALLRAGRGVKLVGTDLGPQLIKALNKLGDTNMEQKDVLAAIDAWEQEKLVKSRNATSTHDRAECLRVFACFGPTLGAAIGYAEHIFAAQGPVQLLSGHKSKGLEWDTVYHLDPHRVPSPFARRPSEEYEQELNVKYVIETRAKKALFLIRLDGFNGDLEE
jgi:ATP-dependent DNA helicase UvrD/PcrA